MGRDPRFVKSGRRHRVETLKFYAITGADQCVFCGREISLALPANHEQRATCNHTIPRSYGGLDHHSNYEAACSKCNSSLGNRTVAQWLKSAKAPAWAIPGWVCNPGAAGVGTPSREWW